MTDTTKAAKLAELDTIIANLHAELDAMSNVTFRSEAGQYRLDLLIKYTAKRDALAKMPTEPEYEVIDFGGFAITCLKPTAADIAAIGSVPCDSATADAQAKREADHSIFAPSKHNDALEAELDAMDDDDESFTKPTNFNGPSDFERVLYLGRTTAFDAHDRARGLSLLV